jgi:hypothetical protein
MKKIVPITRLGKFFGGEDLSLEVDMGMEWLHGDMNFNVVLYRVDREKTKMDDIYGETIKDGVVFMTPVELKGYVKISQPSNKELGGSKISMKEPANLLFSIYQKQLDELGVDILKGDYLGYYETETKVRYYSVVDDGYVTSDLKHTYGGVKPFYRTITATWVTENEFRGL